MDSKCWSCQEETENSFCVKCGKIQPLSPAEDYFAALGLERKLNLNLPQVEKKFHALSRKFHPDFFQGKSKEEQAISLENASILNKAYRTLKDPVSRIEYLLQVEQGSKEAILCQVPFDLLEEVMELHTRLEEVHSLKEGGNPQELKKVKDYLQSELVRLEAAYQALKNQIQQLSDEWDGLKKEGKEYETKKPGILSDFRQILSQRTYLINVIEDIRKVL
jgi:molecular chaperone HscB